MRDIVLALALLVYIPMAVTQPFVGLLLWTWVAINAPNRQVYGFLQSVPLNLVIAVVTIGAWLVSSERKRLTPDAMPWLMLAFIAWFTLASVFAIDPDWSWPYWTRTMKIFIYAFLAFTMLTTKARLHALVWMLVISIGYYSVKGGLFAIVTGGHSKILGPPDTTIADNNQLALAVVMTIPLVNYLRLHTRDWLLRKGLALSIGLQVLMVIGSYSRGGVLTLGVLGFQFWLRSRRRVLYAALAAVALIGVVSALPPELLARINTIGSADKDGSFLSRVQAWQVATLVALDRFPFGAGFYGPQRDAVWFAYLPDSDKSHATHSIYFQVLGEHGFPGLAIYLAILLLGLRNCLVIMRRTRGRPGMRWAEDLARMILTSLICFAAGGSALSMAYWDEYLVLLAMLSSLLMLTSPATAPISVRAEAWTPAAAA